MSTGTTYSKTISKMMLFMAPLLVVSLTGCGGGDGGGTPAMGGPTPLTPVNLGTAGDLKAAGSYLILTETSIVNTPTSTTIRSNAHLEGIILGKTTIAL